MQAAWDKSEDPCGDYSALSLRASMRTVGRRAVSGFARDVRDGLVPLGHIGHKGRVMEPNLFSFIWKYSKRQQLWLLVLTLVSFPFLYLSLEIPKKIINDAIGAQSAQIDVYGLSFTQVEYLLLLCFAFFAAVLVSGLMKMHINTLKGVLAERMLRRLRYQLISRMLRFPKPYFRTTSQGELVSMITSEAEPMGGLMGDALAQPVFQFGQMMTIIFFLFMQSFWFGIASIALIPLQAWLIPMLQRQINLMNKERIVQVRKLSTEIGETAAGITDLRVNGGWRCSPNGWASSSRSGSGSIRRNIS